VQAGRWNAASPANGGSVSGAVQMGTRPWASHHVRRGPGDQVPWPATPAAVRQARSAVVRSAREAGVSEAGLADVKLAVGEACTNAVMHAWVTCDQPAAEFTTATAVTGGRFHVWVADEGRGAVPARPGQGAGIGLSVMQQLSAGMDVGVLPDGGTQVMLSFALETA
jgi:anti-sigma regulatory factor (Ser/Thr protein kinase)